MNIQEKDTDFKIKGWKISTETRLLGTDPRLIDEKAINDPNSKVNKCIDNIFNEYKDSEEIIENHKKNLENSNLEYEKPFPYKEEYKAKLAR
mgnify:CR=1 FL=1